MSKRTLSYYCSQGTRPRRDLSVRPLPPFNTDKLCRVRHPPSGTFPHKSVSCAHPHPMTAVTCALTSSVITLLPSSDLERACRAHSQPELTSQIKQSDLDLDLDLDLSAKILPRPT